MAMQYYTLYSLVIGSPVSDQNSAYWIAIRHQTVSGGDVNRYTGARRVRSVVVVTAGRGGDSCLAVRQIHRAMSSPADNKCRRTAG